MFIIHIYSLCKRPKEGKKEIRIMTGDVSTAVGCAVGIPVGVGVIVACLFWIRMQRRLKQEDVLDQELNRAVYDESGFVSFDNLDTMKVKSDGAREGADELAQSSDLEESGARPEDLERDDKQRSSRYYVPAYKRKMNHHKSMIQREQRGKSLGLSTDSISTEAPLNSKSRQVSVYDQMIPVLNNGSSTQVNGSPMNNANESRTSIFHPDISTNNSTSFLETRSNDNLIKNLNSHDFGSYYPRRPSTPNINASQSSFHTRNSSMLSFSKVENAENIFATPKSEDVLKHANMAQSEKMNTSSVEEDNTVSTSTGDENKSNDVYMLKNNYDLKNNEEITEEDQYENEFTNYSENKREFIDSLRPKM